MSNGCCENLSRRDLLKSAACGFGLTAFRHLLADASDDPLAPRPAPQPARARRVIFLFMHGGPSHLDTFDYKPQLQADHGKTLPYAIPRLQKAQGRNLGKLLASPFSFSRHGRGGLWISELFPRIAERADDLCVLNGMHTDGVDHGQATNRLHTGSDTLVRPSLGAWVSYGLGTENRNLPAFVTISPLKGDTGVRSYSNAFLPAAFQGTPIGSEGMPARLATVRHLTNDQVAPDRQHRQLDLLRSADEEHAASRPGDDRLDGMIRSFELAFRMQAAAPAVLDLSGESEETLKLYGIGQEPTDDFGRQCLLARRMAEAGVRYIQVTHTQLRRDYPDWDQHAHLKAGLEANASQVDRPIAALLTDLKRRGLLDDTLVVWGGEFGRTPVTEGRSGSFGRDHNPYGYSMWLAGGGVKGGFRYGATDDHGYYAVEDKVHVHDLHATILHLMGIDHEKLTYRYAGRDFRLTDVYGRVVKELLA
ncbi:MAG TPA: DUF1501 domain-containing protein [Candidatus Binatia bacterium]|nr:DUF1501 domain-containing protein [Candidatus Binatia bacterium]